MLRDIAPVSKTGVTLNGDALRRMWSDLQVQKDFSLRKKRPSGKRYYEGKAWNFLPPALSLFFQILTERR